MVSAGDGFLEYHLDPHQSVRADDEYRRKIVQAQRWAAGSPDLSLSRVAAACRCVRTLLQSRRNTDRPSGGWLFVDDVTAGVARSAKVPAVLVENPFDSAAAKPQVGPTRPTDQHLLLGPRLRAVQLGSSRTVHRPTGLDPSPVPQKQDSGPPRLSAPSCQRPTRTTDSLLLPVRRCP